MSRFLARTVEIDTGGVAAWTPLAGVLAAAPGAALAAGLSEQPPNDRQASAMATLATHGCELENFMAHDKSAPDWGFVCRVSTLQSCGKAVAGWPSLRFRLAFGPGQNRHQADG